MQSWIWRHPFYARRPDCRPHGRRLQQQSRRVPRPCWLGPPGARKDNILPARILTIADSRVVSAHPGSPLIRPWIAKTTDQHSEAWSACPLTANTGQAAIYVVAVIAPLSSTWQTEPERHARCLLREAQPRNLRRMKKQFRSGRRSFQQTCTCKAPWLPSLDASGTAHGAHGLSLRRSSCQPVLQWSVLCSSWWYC